MVTFPHVLSLSQMSVLCIALLSFDLPFNAPKNQGVLHPLEKGMEERGGLMQSNCPEVHFDATKPVMISQ